MNKNLFDPHMKSLEEMEMPRDLHAKIMKRVFIAGYGRYLYLSSAVLFVNLSVLSVELYRKLSSIDYAQLSHSFTMPALYAALPIQTLVATGITAALCAYMVSLFMKLHNNSMNLSFFRGLAR